MEIRTLYECRMSDKTHLTPELVKLYGGDLQFPSGTGLYTIANFVATLDGVVAFGSGDPFGHVGLGNEADRFIMGLLRTLADVVLVGAGTFHADAGHLRTPGGICFSAESAYINYRTLRGLSRFPLVAILSGNGMVDLGDVTFHTEGIKTLIITTTEGAAGLRDRYGEALSCTTVRSLGEGGEITPTSVVQLLAAEFRARLLLLEGGPNVFGQFLAAGVVDELFLTQSPLVAGHGALRQGLTSAIQFQAETAPKLMLLSVKEDEDFLYVRYGCKRS